MPPTLVLVRHARAEHNAIPEEGKVTDDALRDPNLTVAGREQCKALRASLQANPLAQQAELIVVSPMRRTLQTAQASLDWLIQQGVRVEADADWQENSDKPCDTGVSVDALKEEFSKSGVDFSRVDPIWPDKTSPAAKRYHYSRAAVLDRGQHALERLYRRPEKVIVVVSHSGFLRLSVSGRRYANADYRIFDFSPDSGTTPYRLLEHESTKVVHGPEKSGGLGWSDNETVVLGSTLPPRGRSGLPREWAGVIFIVLSLPLLIYLPVVLS